MSSPCPNRGDEFIAQTECELSSEFHLLSILDNLFWIIIVWFLRYDDILEGLGQKPKGFAEKALRVLAGTVEGYK